MGDQERLPKVYETLHLSPSICIYSCNIYFNLNLVSLLCRKAFQNELKSKSWIFIFYISKIAWDSLRLTQFMAENKSRIEMILKRKKIAGLQHSANATNIRSKALPRYCELSTSVIADEEFKNLISDWSEKISAELEKMKRVNRLKNYASGFKRLRYFRYFAVSVLLKWARSPSLGL